MAVTEAQFEGAEERAREERETGHALSARYGRRRVRETGAVAANDRHATLARDTDQPRKPAQRATRKLLHRRKHDCV